MRSGRIQPGRSPAITMARKATSSKECRKPKKPWKKFEKTEPWKKTESKSVNTLDLTLITVKAKKIDQNTTLPAMQLKDLLV
jgi:hypothetical protein